MEENKQNHNGTPPPTSLRSDLVRLLQIEKPDTDFTDDEALYQQVIDDYEDYARLILDEQQRTVEAEKYRTNVESSMTRLVDAYPESKLNAATDLLRRISADIAQGIFTDEAVTAAIKALDYDTDIAEAETRGRNAKIAEQVLSAPVTDGLPHLGGADSYSPSSASSIFDMARSA